MCSPKPLICCALASYRRVRTEEVPTSRLTTQVVGTISRYSMFGPGARVGVAVSGGADSVCLLHVLFELQPIWNLDIGIVHLNHQLRGEESESDEQFVQGLGRPVHVERVSLRDGNIEEAGREARRALFRKLIENGTFD